MIIKKHLEMWLKIVVAGIALSAFLLTFTISDYYIFNKITEFGIVFCLSQWVKKAGLVALVLAVFYKKRSFADCAKYILPIAVILSFIGFFNGFFDITKTAQTPAEEIFNSINLFFPKWLNMAVFVIQNILILFISALFFIRDGYRANAKGFLYFAIAFVACTPLNICENFFDITQISPDSPLRFRNFSVWHWLALILLFSLTAVVFLLLRNKSKEYQNAFLGGIAVTLLIQYHSKDSVIIGDGYNVYHTLFACIPLFICNIGMYTASLSVFLKKKTLYAICFFVHAVGALSVFLYFGNDNMSNFGIFCSYSFLYFISTHSLLFVLCVMPTMLGHYAFKWKDCFVPLVYYFVIIILASLSSALVTSASSIWHTQSGYYLEENEWLLPNYAFTQINPLPFNVPPIITITIWKYKINVLYVLGLYGFYVGMFLSFTAAYYLLLFVKRKLIDRNICAIQSQAESAATDDEQ
jgi:hypothetical protein